MFAAITACLRDREKSMIEEIRVEKEKNTWDGRISRKEKGRGKPYRVKKMNSVSGMRRQYLRVVRLFDKLKALVFGWKT